MTPTPTTAAAAAQPRQGTAAPWRIDDELDLRFFFSGASVAGGMRSNLGPQLDALASGVRRRGVVQPALSDDEMVERLDRAARIGRVGRVLQTIGSERARVLEGAYNVDQVAPPAARQRYGELAGVVAVVFGGDDDGRLAALARDRAAAALKEAQAAYAAARFTANAQRRAARGRS